jgi:hypothetical protein
MTPVQICNLALAKIGDVAQVTAISPPDGSMQASYCALFYPQALSVLLMRNAWSFALRALGLNQLLGSYAVTGTTMAVSMAGHGLRNGASYNFNFEDPNGVYDSGNIGTSYTVTVVDANDFTLTVPAGGAASGSINVTHREWRYAYAAPADLFNIAAVRPQRGYDGLGLPNGMNFAFESNVVYCDWANPVLEYTSNLSLTDTYFPPLFTEALAVLLASYLAGPMIKGDTGAAAAQKMGQVFELALKQAVEADGMYRQTRPVYVPDGIRARAPGIGLPGYGEPWSGNMGGSNNVY